MAVLWLLKKVENFLSPPHPPPPSPITFPGEGGGGRGGGGRGEGGGLNKLKNSQPKYSHAVDLRSKVSIDPKSFVKGAWIGAPGPILSQRDLN